MFPFCVCIQWPSAPPRFCSFGALLALVSRGSCWQCRSGPSTPSLSNSFSTRVCHQKLFQPTSIWLWLRHICHPTLLSARSLTLRVRLLYIRLRSPALTGGLNASNIFVCVATCPNHCNQVVDNARRSGVAFLSIPSTS